MAKKPRLRSLKGDPAMQVARYRCGHPGCPDRLLLGVRNQDHIIPAYVNVRLMGWVYDNTKRQFYCAEHREESIDGTDKRFTRAPDIAADLRTDSDAVDVNVSIPSRDGLDPDVVDGDYDEEPDDEVGTSTTNVSDNYVRFTEDYIHVGWRSR